MRRARLRISLPGRPPGTGTGAERAAADRVGRLGRRIGRSDPYWPAQLTILAALLLYLTLPSKLTIGPNWLVPGCEALALVGLVLSTPRGGRPQSAGRRKLAIALIALVSLVNLVALELLVHFLLRGGRAGGHALILAGIEIWVTNVLVFALWYWELDRGGPQRRGAADAPYPDFLFPQMSEPEVAEVSWTPNFVDYLYTSFTNATAFSPTDTMPLTARAKLLMLVQSAAALVTIGLVAARAVNILS